MDRRTAVAMMAAGGGGALATSALATAAQAQVPEAMLRNFGKLQPGTVRLDPSQEFKIDAKSQVLEAGGKPFSVITIKTGRFWVDKEFRLQGLLKGEAIQHHTADYRINVVVFNSLGFVIGAAAVEDQVIHVEGSIKILREYKVDFGVSANYQTAVMMAVAISVPVLAKG